MVTPLALQPVGPVSVEVGSRMRQARQARGWSLVAVERLSGGRWMAVRIGSWERGDRGISVPVLCEYADFLGVPVASLFPSPVSVPVVGRVCPVCGVGADTPAV